MYRHCCIEFGSDHLIQTGGLCRSWPTSALQQSKPRNRVENDGCSSFVEPGMIWELARMHVMWRAACKDGCFHSFQLAVPFTYANTRAVLLGALYILAQYPCVATGRLSGQAHIFSKPIRFAYKYKWSMKTCVLPWSTKFLSSAY
jgi:hypothetical protein